MPFRWQDDRATYIADFLIFSKQYIVGLFEEIKLPFFLQRFTLSDPLCYPD